MSMLNHTWYTKKSFEETLSLHRIVIDRTQNICEYYLITEMLVLASNHVDHVIAEKHGRESIANLISAMIFDPPLLNLHEFYSIYENRDKILI